MVRLALLAVVAGMVTITGTFSAGSTPAAAENIECSMLNMQHIAQVLLRSDPSDPNGLDGPDDNGIACDDLPCPCNLEPVLEAIGDGTNAAAVTEAATPSPTSTPNVGLPASTPTVYLEPDPTATSPPPASSSLITPPSTGSAGIRR